MMALRIAIAVACISSVTSAQTKTPKQAGQKKPSDNGPTMAETAAWFETELPRIAQGVTTSSSHSTTDGFDIQQVLRIRTEGIKLSNCVWSWTEHDTIITGSPQAEKLGAKPQTTILESFYLVPLAAIDIATIRPDESLLKTDSPSAYVQFKTIASAGKAIQRAQLGKPRDSVDVVAFRVLQMEDRPRLVSALSRAAELCGAKRSPF